MHENATKCNKTIGKWCKNKHGESKIIDTFETYQRLNIKVKKRTFGKGSSDCKFYKPSKIMVLTSFEISLPPS
jgi:hypothetical protein